jgi:hypothetical protein
VSIIIVETCVVYGMTYAVKNIRKSFIKIIDNLN